ncbi:ectoderm-neural cortex protein 1-like [Arctopsyche grandis]|uniref:ectoderm-neural cortex protein 1-like n=1 Tax=Arctopsyche grandis TaxID=121162 RepID=UPI00406D9259
MIEVNAKPDFAKNQTKYLYDAMGEKKFTDVIFSVGKRSFHAHIIVLAACSEFFIENRTRLNPVFAGFKYPVIDAIFKYCYTGKISIADEHYENFLSLADKLQIKNVAPRYETINEINCLEVLSLSDDPVSKKKAMSLTFDNYKTLYKTPGFLSLPDSVLDEILKSDKLRVSAEEAFDSVKLWVDYDGTNRRSELVQLLGSMKLTLLPFEFLVDKFMLFCSSYPECIEILRQTMQKSSANCQNSFKIEENDKIALIGDLHYNKANSIDVYDGKNNTWTLKEDFKFNRSRFASVLIDHWIMIIGGFMDPSENIDFNRDSGFNLLDSSQVDYIDLKDGQQHQLKPLNQSRYFFSAVTFSHNSTTDVYAIGGLKNLDSLSSVERWNSNTKNWDSNVAPLLQAVDRHSACVIGDRIYVISGETKKNRKDVSVNRTQVYSVRSNSWSYVAPMKQGRYGHSSIVIKGKLYVAGGRSYYKHELLKSVESYDVDGNLWTDYCNLPAPDSDNALCLFRDKLLLIGGYTNGVWELDVSNITWKKLKSLSTNRGTCNAFVIPYDSKI